MQQKSYKYIFFDLDRTLWDFVNNSADALKDILMEFNISMYITDKEEFIEKYNHYNDRLWDNYREGKIRKPLLRQERFRLLLKDYGIHDENLVEEISRFYLNSCAAKPKLIKDAKEILEYLYTKYKLYIISNGFYDVQLTKLISSEISKYFTKVFTSDRIGYAKPNAKIFEYAIQSENAKKSECLMVGDDIVNDIQGAKNVNIDQVFFNPDNIKTTIESTYAIADLSELRKIL